jgi:UDP-N-acetylmuramyl pentapeptide synthase
MTSTKSSKKLILDDFFFYNTLSTKGNFNNFLTTLASIKLNLNAFNSFCKVIYEPRVAL